MVTWPGRHSKEEMGGQNSTRRFLYNDHTCIYQAFVSCDAFLRLQKDEETCTSVLFQGSSSGKADRDCDCHAFYFSSASHVAVQRAHQREMPFAKP